MLIAEQLSILQFRQDDQLDNAAYYDCFTTRVEVACQAGVCNYSPDLLDDKTTRLKLGSYDTLSGSDKTKVIDSVEQEYLAYLFLNNSNAKMHSQLQKDVANDYSKGNTDAYLSWKCRRHVATCRRRHTVSLQFWPDGSVLPTFFFGCHGSLCRLEPTFTRFFGIRV